MSLTEGCKTLVIMKGIGASMFFGNKKREEPDAGPPSRRLVPEEELLKKAYHIGKFSPSNCECPPAPNIIPVWIDNNVDAFEISVDRFFSEFEVLPATLPKIFVAIFEGFRDLIRSCPDEGDSPFCMSQEEVIEISKEIFVRLAKKKGVSLDFSH